MKQIYTKNLPTLTMKFKFLLNEMLMLNFKYK
jgi:hypothetical protein